MLGFLPLSLSAPIAAFAALPPLLVSAEAPARRPTLYLCDDGLGFGVQFFGDRVLVTTVAGSWTLHRYRSSIGTMYVSDSAAFIHDEDRAALRGLPGGPFRRCREEASGRPRSRGRVARR